jgi:mannose-6-phosphate isomerase-like protein (cupin superfamily)
MIERIEKDTIELALIIRRSFNKDGVEFFTPDDYSQQIGYMNRPAGHLIPPHVHNPVAREVHFTREVLIIRSGKLRVDLYTDEREYVESAILESGDIILLASGGHGFEVLEDTEMIEVKQGPYAGDGDKTRFEGVDASRVILKSSMT